MSSVTDAELNAAAQKLIEEANAESEAALAEYERDCLSARFRLLERGTYRSSILQDSLNELRAAYDKLVLRIQRELDESLEALYAEAEEPDDGEDPGGDGEDPGGDGEDPGGDGEDPGGDGEDPGGDGEDPGGDGEDPGGDGNRYTYSGEDPGGDGEDPGGDGEDPGGDGEDPAVTAKIPMSRRLPTKWMNLFPCETATLPSKIIIYPFRMRQTHSKPCAMTASPRNISARITTISSSCSS